MTSNRRIGTETSETRKLLLQAAAELMRDEGYAEVTSRKLARKAGLKPQLVHYYFRTMGDLFTALFHQVTLQHLSLLDEAAMSDNPLVRMFELSCDPTNAALQMEFLALANHRKEMHALIAEFGHELNTREAAIIRAAIPTEGLAKAKATPEELATIIQTAARGLAFAGRFNTERFNNARGAVIGWLKLLAAG
jgi:TetR/AcrR family transcriptional regulator